MDKQINETLVSGTIKVRETRVFCFCDVNSRSDPYGKKTVDTAFSVSAPTAAVAEEKMLLFENASGQKPLRRHYIVSSVQCCRVLFICWYGVEKNLYYTRFG